jgi:IS30 family transposase
MSSRSPAFLRSQVAALCDLIRAGHTVEEAAACLGMKSATAHGWLHKAGGVMPLPTEHTGSYRRLSIGEREQIHAGMERGDTVRAIAASIGRPPSTVSREIAKNLWHQKYGRKKSCGRKRTSPWNYSPHRAQRRADQLAARTGTAKLATNQRLRAEVQDRLEDKHSPEQIARRLREEFPEDPEMWVSHETIYQSIYVQSRGALKRELAVHLRTGRAVRRPRRKAGQRRPWLSEEVHISQRPKEAADRAVPGHWEGDLITGTQNKSAIGTLVERTTGFVALLHLPDDHGALAVQESMVEAIETLPEQLRKTVTWDQGTEMANHVAITLATDVKFYFCDPGKPWQRPSNENTNGLLRQYFPKGTDLSGYHSDYLAFVANQLNDRPRKRLNWKTPKEALTALLSDPTDPPGVALAG